MNKWLNNLLFNNSKLFYDLVFCFLCLIVFTGKNSWFFYVEIMISIRINKFPKQRFL